MGNRKNNAGEPKKITYLVGDFSQAVVFVGNGLWDKQISPEEFKKPVHDVEFRGQTYRFWNADRKFYHDLKKRPNTFVFPESLAGRAITVNKDGIYDMPLPALDKS
jgi:hypothetical protein